MTGRKQALKKGGSKLGDRGQVLEDVLSLGRYVVEVFEENWRPWGRRAGVGGR